MPPYKPVTSKAQARTLFRLAELGEISEADARGKVRAADWSSLPARVKPASSTGSGNVRHMAHPTRNLGSFAHPPKAKGR